MLIFCILKNVLLLEYCMFIIQNFVKLKKNMEYYSILLFFLLHEKCENANTHSYLNINHLIVFNLDTIYD